LINIKVYRKREGTVCIRVRGHGGGKKGEDIVCAAVSAITQTALAGLLYYAENIINWQMDEGFLDISISGGPDDELDPAVETILRTMVLGLKGVLSEYPKVVRLDIGNEFDVKSSKRY
jgi:uncharacterized protein YsxB (DUF464 family)